MNTTPRLFRDAATDAVGGLVTESVMLNPNNTETRPMPKLNQKEMDRFWSNVAITSNPQLCWNWLFGKGRGYGAFPLRNKTYCAHRVSYFLHTNVDPLNMVVRHQCHNKGCVNPNHLLIGTPTDNYEDSVKKYKADGKDHWNTKLKERDVLQIINDFENDENLTYGDLGEKYRVNKSTIFDIIHKRTWKYISNPIKKHAVIVKGERNGMTKLKSIEVYEIIKTYAEGNFTYKQLADKYNVAPTNICSIILGKSWKHLHQNLKSS